MNVIIATVKVQPQEPDKRDRTLIMLNRSERKKYWIFRCPKCTRAVCEILNGDVVAMSDLVDIDSIANFGNGVRCDGSYRDMFGHVAHCRQWYYFSLNEAK